MGINWARLAVLLAIYALGLVAQIVFIPVAFIGGVGIGFTALHGGWIDGVQ